MWTLLSVLKKVLISYDNGFNNKRRVEIMAIIIIIIIIIIIVAVKTNNSVQKSANDWIFL